jgi:hypothetical protein
MHTDPATFDPGTAHTQGPTPASGDVPPSPSNFVSLESPPSLRQWLVLRRNAGTTPAGIAAELVERGWDADAAARVSLSSLRSADRQSLTYAGATISAGLAGLALASSLHLILAGNPHPLDLTLTLTVWLITTPIAVVTTMAARRAEARSNFVMWSPSRRGWFGALAFCTGTVGLVRLLAYLYSAIATLTGASDDPFTVVAAAQVAVTLMVAIPLFIWSFREWRRSNLVISALTPDSELTGATDR